MTEPAMLQMIADVTAERDRIRTVNSKLLETLREIANYDLPHNLQPWDVLVANARAAIATATGGTER